MSKEKYDKIAEALVVSHGVEVSQMFGKPCLKINGKAFAAFHQEAMVFKLGREAIEELLLEYPDSKNWDPSGKGRAMKDWLQVPVKFSNSWDVLVKRTIED